MLNLRSLIRSLKFTVLDRYILKDFIFALIGSQVLFISIYELTAMFQDLRFVPPNLNFLMYIQHYVYDGLFYTTQLEPFSFLFATVYVLSKLAQSKELLAIVSTGTSIYRITIYFIVFSTLLYVFIVFVFNNAVVYPAYQKKITIRRIMYDHVDPQKDKDNRNFSIFGANNLIYIIGDYDSAAKILNNITIVQSDKIISLSDKNVASDSNNDWLITNMMEVIKMKNLNYPSDLDISIRIDADRAIWDSTQKKWVFNKGTIRYVKNAGQNFVINNFTNQTFPFIVDPPYYFEKAAYSLDAMTYEEGWLYIDKLKKSHQDYRDALARQLAKYSYSIGFIFIVFAGIGIIDLSRRKNSFIVNLFISMLLFVFYFLFYSVGLSLAGKGDISPQAGAFSGAIILGIASMILYFRVKT